MAPDEHDRRRRIAYTRMNLRLETVDQLIELEWVHDSAWCSFAKAAGEHHPLGFAAPMLLGGRLVVYACAEVLVDVARHLGDPAFFAWVANVRTHLHLHIIQMELGLPPDLEEVGVVAEQREMPDVDFNVYEGVANRAEERT